MRPNPRLAVEPSSPGVLLRHVWVSGAATALRVRGGGGVGLSVVAEDCAFDDWGAAAVDFEVGVDVNVIRTPRTERHYLNTLWRLSDFFLTFAAAPRASTA
jgi:hypothetical protein